MTYESFRKNLNSRGLFRIRPSLDRIRQVLNVLDNPQDRVSAVHIAGTNGKGSVAAALESVLRACGYRTGLYTSPHLIDLRERVRIDGTPMISGFTPVAEEVLAAEKCARAPLTYFELLTTIAFQSFAARKVDIAIVECGLGGLWDATNVIRQPLLSILTSIGLDHTDWLGSDEYHITAQKAGIIKPGSHVISGVRDSWESIVVRTAREKKATLEQIDLDFSAELLTTSWASGKQTIRFNYQEEPPQIIPFGLLGQHQADNAALVMAAIRHLKTAGWRIPDSHRDEGLRSVSWPGRLQLLRRHQSSSILLDGAHNPPAMKRLLESIESSPFRNVPKAFVFSAFKDKDYLSMAKMIAESATEICLCALAGPRGTSVRKLREAFLRVKGPVRGFPSIREAVLQALKDTPKDGLIVMTGSLALIGEVLKTIPLEKKDTVHA